MLIDWSIDRTFVPSVYSYRSIPIFWQLQICPLIGVTIFVHCEGRVQRSFYCLFMGHTISAFVCLLCKKWKDESKMLALIGLLLEIISFMLFIRELKKMTFTNWKYTCIDSAKALEAIRCEYILMVYVESVWLSCSHVSCIAMSCYCTPECSFWYRLIL
jgi:hypothetical protein